VLKLERIPLEILILLLEHKDEIVTRDQIVSRVWGQGVFLDTDNSIRGAIRKLRPGVSLHRAGDQSQASNCRGDFPG
jgi:DNA-binding response OmpR family regulator